MSTTIYHNPSCGTLRNTLAMIRRSGEEPEIIEYLKAPPTRERLRAMRVRPRALLPPYDELGLDDQKWTDDELIAVMLEHPILLNEILSNPNIGEFTKEGGEVIAARKEGAE